MVRFASLLVSAWVTFGLTAGVLCAQELAPTPSRPNIIYFLADDLGWAVLDGMGARSRRRISTNWLGLELAWREFLRSACLHTYALLH